MKEVLIGKIGNFYKANLHCHSTNSDGQYKPEELKELYKSHGYSVLSLTDHNVMIPHHDLTDKDILFITGVEINFNNADPWPYYKTYHLNFFAKDKNIKEFVKFDISYNQDVVNKAIKIASDNFLVQYNHPRWSYQLIEEFKDLENLWGFEIYNHGCEIEMLNGYGEYEYESYCRLNVDKLNKFPATVATDDNHNYHKGETNPRSDSFGGFSMIEATELTYEAIIEAMENHQMYASTGPLIYSLVKEDNQITIKTSPCSAILLLTETRDTSLVRSINDDICEATLTIPTNSKTFRIEVTNKKREKALTKTYKVR